MANIESILSQFWKGSQPAHGLPADAYRSQEFWDLECNTVLKQNWVCVGFAHELKEVGDVIPVTVANLPLMLLARIIHQNFQVSSGHEGLAGLTAGV